MYSIDLEGKMLYFSRRRSLSVLTPKTPESRGRVGKVNGSVTASVTRCLKLKACDRRPVDYLLQTSVRSRPIPTISIELIYFGRSQGISAKTADLNVVDRIYREETPIDVRADFYYGILCIFR